MKAVALAFKERLPLENSFRTVADSIIWAHIGVHLGLDAELFIVAAPELRYFGNTFSDYICALRSEHSLATNKVADEVNERCEFVEVIVSVSNKQFKKKENKREFGKTDNR